MYLHYCLKQNGASKLVLVLYVKYNSIQVLTFYLSEVIDVFFVLYL